MERGWPIRRERARGTPPALPLLVAGILLLVAGAAVGPPRAHPGGSAPAPAPGPTGAGAPVATLRPTRPNGGPNTIFATLNVGLNPDAGAYDASNGYIYFTNSGSGNVSVVDGASNQIISSIPAGVSPSAVTVDSANGEVYVSNYGSYLGSGALYSNVSVLYADSVIAVVPAGVYPEGSAFDSANQMIYVANAGSNNVTVINGTTNTASSVISVGAYHTPAAVAYDSQLKELFVSEQQTNQLTVLSGTNNSILGNVSVGNYPGPSVYDPANGFLYVVNEGTNNVSVVNASNRTVVASIPVGVSPDGIAYDSYSNTLYVSNFKSGNLTILNASNESGAGSVTVQHGPDGLTYDPSNHCIYVANYDTDSVTVVQTASNSCDEAQYPVTFSQTGLPSGALWSVNFDVLKGESTSGRMVFQAANGTFPFVVPHADGYYATPRNGSIQVDGSNVTESIRFAVIPLTTYNVTFREAGLPPGTTWSVTLGTGTQNSSSPTVTFEKVRNGTYAYSIAELYLYSPSPASGRIVVNGFSLTNYTNYTANPTYSVLFEGSGLPAGMTWSVDFNGQVEASSAASVLFSGIPDGTYEFSVGNPPGYRAAPESGPIVVFGKNDSQSVTFLAVPPSTYSVTFQESGLGTGARWSVVWNGTAAASTTATVVINGVRNGTYPFRVAPYPGMVASPPSGTVAVAGTSRQVTIAFSANASLRFAIRFVETGLTAGAAWAVTIDGALSARASGPVVLFPSMAPGNYTYAVSAIVGFEAHPDSGNVTLAGGNRSVAVGFTPAATSPAAGSLSPILLLGLLLIAVVAAGLLSWRYARRRRGRRVDAEMIPPTGGTQ